MTGDNRIIAFGGGGGEPSSGESGAPEEKEGKELLLTDSVVELDESEGDLDDFPRAPRRQWIYPAIAGSAAALWTGFFAWAHWQDVAGGIAPSEGASLVVNWSVPLILIGIAWLVAVRNSRREALRFGEAARLLADESEHLEARLLTVNRELSLAREFIAAQSRDLESLGRVAADRLSHNADRLEELIRDNGERVASIGSVSETALENMEKLRGQLPVIASSAKDVTNNIGNAGRTAHAQIEEMIGGFKRLNEFGQACSREVLNLREHTGETIAEFQRHCDQMEEIATQRFAALNEQGEEFRTRLDTLEVEALAAIRSRAGAMAEELEAARQLMASEEEDRLAALRQRLEILRDEGGEITRSLIEGEREAIEKWQAGLAEFETGTNALFASIDEAQDRMREAARERQSSVERDAAQIEAQLIESNRIFSDGIVRIRGEAELASEGWIVDLSERLEAVSQAIAERGREMSEQISRQHEELRSQHDQALADFREKCTGLDAELAERIDGILSRIGRHHGALGESHASLVADLSARFEAIEAEAKERGERIEREIERRRSDFSAAEKQALNELRGQLAQMDEEIARHLADHEQQGAAIAQRATEAAAELEESSTRLSAIAEQGEEAHSRISKSLQAITNGIFHAESLLGRAEKEIGQLTDASVRLLELIQASANSSSSELPEAIAIAEDRLASLGSELSQLGEALDEASSKGDAISGSLVASGETLQALVSRAEELAGKLRQQGAENAQTYSSLFESLEALDGKSRALAQQAREELSAALDELSRSAQAAIATISETGGASISELAGKLGAESAEAIERAIRNATAEASGKLEQAASHASGVSREAVVQLRDQLAMVNELVGNLEQRVAHARARAEEQVDNDFSRRAALITESLNSNAIDIAKALSTDVSDTAWAAYLRGDRGIFSRRAVSLLENAEAKRVQQIYERDEAFREHVSRYIHDFEAILRQVLSTRDGHALGVTLLSSDMGKLYVALAQGIERLRE
jgi:chromosome segregation ATPase